MDSNRASSLTLTSLFSVLWVVRFFVTSVEVSTPPSWPAPAPDVGCRVWSWYIWPPRDISLHRCRRLPRWLLLGICKHGMRKDRVSKPGDISSTTRQITKQNYRIEIKNDPFEIRWHTVTEISDTPLCRWPVLVPCWWNVSWIWTSNGISGGTVPQDWQLWDVCPELRWRCQPFVVVLSRRTAERFVEGCRPWSARKGDEMRDIFSREMVKPASSDVLSCAHISATCICWSSR